MRKAAELMDQRIYEMGAVVSLEVGKNGWRRWGMWRRRPTCSATPATGWRLRMLCDQMGFDPLVGYQATNVSVLRPYGVWVVISPFNFPAALSGGPTGAALVAGNTVVLKPATDTPWTSRMIAECLRDAGVPAGVFNYITGPGSTLGQAVIENSEVDGITFTGSYDVGMKIYRDFASGRWVRPIILELGGKNPAIVSRHADLETAARASCARPSACRGRSVRLARGVRGRTDVRATGGAPGGN